MLITAENLHTTGVEFVLNYTIRSIDVCKPSKSKEKG